MRKFSPSKFAELMERFQSAADQMHTHYGKGYERPNLVKFANGTDEPHTAEIRNIATWFGVDVLDITEEVPYVPKPDPINPSYYKSGGMEAADIMDAYDLGRWPAMAVKYLLRAGKKGDGIEDHIKDLEKSIWYVKREIDRLKKSQAPA